jgi:biotin/methionine sulfoxide reductase
MSHRRLHAQLTAPEDVPAEVLIADSDAAGLGISDGQLVLLHNERGRCLASARTAAEILPGVLCIENGVPLELDETDPSLCRNGNPNVLTTDRPTSTWSQATAAHSCLVRIDPNPEQSKGVNPQ